jgi:glycosyltransferase involved in cell wall biosynthesis
LSEAVRSAPKSYRGPHNTFSVIVPTWNEAAWLPSLLDRLSPLTSVTEIVIADNSSSDRTRDIALSAGCKVVEGGAPGKGRNAGAAKATRDYLIFADADAVFSARSLEAARCAFDDPGIAAVHFRLEPLGGTRFVRFCYRFMSLYFRLLHLVGVPQGVGTFLAVRRSAFEAAGGFRTDLNAGEDADFVRRLGRVGRVRFDPSICIATSPRRFEVEQPIVFAGKTCFWGLLRLIGVSASVFKYQWQRYPEHLANRDRVLAGRFLDRASSAE